MSLERATVIRIVCDYCLEQYAWMYFDTIKEARTMVESEGWEVRTRNDVRCPQCLLPVEK